jgi:hypothetical protein
MMHFVIQAFSAFGPPARLDWFVVFGTEIGGRDIIRDSVSS